MTRLIFRAEAHAEALDIFRWYEEQRRGLGAIFRDRLKDAIKGVRSNPLAYPVVYRDLRRALVERFPYAIFYRVLPDLIVVVGILHGRRHPRAWRQRA